MRFWRFKFRGLPLITRDVAERLISAGTGVVTVSLDLGLSEQAVRVSAGCAVLPHGETLSLEVLREIAGEDGNSIYVVEGGEVRRLEGWSSEDQAYYKLRFVSAGTAPTLEINGIHMHRISGTTPWEDSKAKVRLLRVKPGIRVLDVCTGLGYTAILARRRGAEVVSVEKSEAVLRFAEYNPWSRELENVKVIHGDACEVVGKLKDGSFDRVMHDPPRFNLVGELYSEAFYRELYRVLRPGGLLLHYVGSPGRLRGRDIVRGVARRLEAAGFKARIVRECKSVLAFKA